MQDAAEECGFRVAGAIAAVAEHSVVRKFAAGRPDEKDRQELHQTEPTFIATNQKKYPEVCSEHRLQKIPC